MIRPADIGVFACHLHFGEILAITELPAGCVRPHGERGLGFHGTNYVASLHLVKDYVGELASGSDLFEVPRAMMPLKMDSVMDPIFSSINTEKPGSAILALSQSRSAEVTPCGSSGTRSSSGCSMLEYGMRMLIECRVGSPSRWQWPRQTSRPLDIGRDPRAQILDDKLRLQGRTLIRETVRVGRGSGRHSACRTIVHLRKHYSGSDILRRALRLRVLIEQM